MFLIFYHANVFLTRGKNLNKNYNQLLKQKQSWYSVFLSGARQGIRTPDPLGVNEML